MLGRMDLGAKDQKHHVLESNLQGHIREIKTHRQFARDRRVKSREISGAPK
jgi:hypothetical protein